jgi:hypothetical protein
MEHMLRGGAATLAAIVALTLSGCGPDQAEPAQQPAAADRSDAAPAAGEADSGHADDGHDAEPVEASPLRTGETRRTVRMSEPYTPSAPYGEGTDDYRCFLLDPGLEQDAWLTGTHVLPGNPDVVHHVILFQVPPGRVDEAEARDAAFSGEGWTCFGGTGLEQVRDVEDAPWLGAWAPGGGESVHGAGYGVRLREGSRIVMQVHYNLLAGAAPDTSATQLRLAPGDRDLSPLHTWLVPAPVELACRPEHADGPLCDRASALADLKERVGNQAGMTADLLHLLCGTETKAGQVQSCTRTVSSPMTVRGVAGHMHLLGRSLRIETNPGTPEARTVLDIPVWDFDNQGSHPIRPVHLDPSDTVKVTCRHVQWLRDQLPSFEGQPDRYVVWGEGTTDEMCLGMLQVTRP